MSLDRFQPAKGTTGTDKKKIKRGVENYRDECHSYLIQPLNLGLQATFKKQVVKNYKSYIGR